MCPGARSPAFGRGFDSHRPLNHVSIVLTRLTCLNLIQKRSVLDPNWTLFFAIPLTVERLIGMEVVPSKGLMISATSVGVSDAVDSRDWR